MRKETYYSWDIDDPSLSFVDHAINLLAAFKDDERDVAGVKAFQRVVVNKHFTSQDLATLKGYLFSLAVRAKEKYAQAELAGAPWRDAILQAIENAKDARTRLDEMFTIGLNPNLPAVSEG